MDVTNMDVTNMDVKNMDVKNIETFNIQGGIENAALRIKFASNLLRTTYDQNIEDVGLKEIRKDVFTYAKIYNDLLLPFSEKTILAIKGLCDQIIIFKNEFKMYLPIIIKETEPNEELCKYAETLYTEMLTEFKRIENKVSQKTGYQNLQSKLEKEEADRNFGFIDQIVAEAKKPNDKLYGILAVLTKSIENYSVFFSQIAGFFNVLHGDLERFHESINCAKDSNSELMFDYYCKTVFKKSGDIMESCNKFIGIIPECKANLKSIDEKIQEGYILEWTKKVIIKENDHIKFIAILDKKKICIS